VSKKEGLITLEKDYGISYFNTGDFNAGPFDVTLLRGDTEVQTLTSNTIPVKIRSVLDEKDTDIKPLKELTEIDGNPLYLLKYLIILLLIAGIVILIFYLVRRRKREQVKPVIPPLPPEVEFLNRIETLWRTDLLKTGKIKRFFLNLTESYKLFMARFYSFNAEDLTTYEILKNLKNHEAERKVNENFEKVFLISDLAKFAKYSPSDVEVEQVRGNLLEIIEIAGQRRKKSEEEATNASL